MKYKIILGLVLAGFYSTVSNAAPELKGNPDELQRYFHPTEKTLTISAKAELTAYSDVAKVNLVVKTEDKLLAKSMELNASLRKNMIATLAQKGVEKSAIKNAKFSSSPNYGWFGSKPDSYEVVNRVTITVSNENQMKAVAELADAHAEVTLSNTVFEHAKKKEYEFNVKEKALAEVMKKQHFYEQALSIKLTPVSFRESDVHFSATQSARKMEAEVGVMSMRDNKSSLSQSAAPIAAVASGPASFDEVKYSAYITVEFKVE